MENVKKCKNFLATLIKLASSGKQSSETAASVRELIKELLVSEPDKWKPHYYDFFFYPLTWVFSSTVCRLAHLCNAYRCKVVLLMSESADSMWSPKLFVVYQEGKVEAEEFTSRLYKELNSSPQPYLVPFLKVKKKLFYPIRKEIYLYIRPWIFLNVNPNLSN